MRSGPISSAVRVFRLAKILPHSFPPCKGSGLELHTKLKLKRQTELEQLREFVECPKSEPNYVAKFTVVRAQLT